MSAGQLARYISIKDEVIIEELSDSSSDSEHEDTEKLKMRKPLL
jgi:hypothetical protein